MASPGSDSSPRMASSKTMSPRSSGTARRQTCGSPAAMRAAASSAGDARGRCGRSRRSRPSRARPRAWPRAPRRCRSTGRRARAPSALERRARSVSARCVWKYGPWSPPTSGPSSQSRPSQRSERRIACGVLVGGALGVGVVDAQDERAAVVPGERPVVDGGAGAADVQVAGGAAGRSGRGRCRSRRGLLHGSGSRDDRRRRSAPRAASLGVDARGRESSHGLGDGEHASRPHAGPARGTTRCHRQREQTQGMQRS